MYNIVNLLCLCSATGSNGEERQNAYMGDDAQPVVHLEITVPRIAFPAEKRSQQQAKMDDEHISQTEHEQEQVRVLLTRPDGRHHAARNAETREQMIGEVATYASPTGSFRLFQIKDIPRQGQKLLLQVLRRLTGRTGHFSLTAEQAFSLEFRHLDSSNQPVEQASVFSSQLIPGLNQIVINLDKDGTVVHFSIDGAES